MAGESRQSLPNQGRILAEQPGCGHRCLGWGMICAGGAPNLGDLVEGRGLDQHRLGNELHLFGRHNQILQSPHQVVLKALHAPCNLIGLAAEAGKDLAVDLPAARFELGNFVLKALALLAQLV